MSAPPRYSVAVLLSGREQFSPYFGGALARWTHEVYSLLTGKADVTVFGFPTKPADLYPLPHETNRISYACQAISHVPLFRRYEETLWLRALIGRLGGFEIVHIHNRPQWVRALRRLGYHGVIALHLQNDHLGHWTGQQLDELAAEVDAVAACSDYLRQTFAPRSAALAAKSYVVFNGANLRRFLPRDEIREPKTIFFAGRFDSEKGVLQLLKAYEIAVKAHPDAKLVIGGAASSGRHRQTAYVRQVRELARRLQNSKKLQIHFTGYLDHDTELPLWFQRATIFACPSLFQEPFGLVNAEAMACATTVVASKRGGIPEVIGEAGRLIDPENIDRFGATLSELLASPEDCRRIGQAGHERCRRMFDWRIIAENWTNVLEACRQRGPAR